MRSGWAVHSAQNWARVAEDAAFARCLASAYTGVNVLSLLVHTSIVVVVCLFD